ncbi:undecaprenyl-diphosphatase [Erythrobacter litoralis]|jgi:undecaprenyl-diphosphatase|uniref:Undecaprenyl-diphosphatase n=1 Tax=Erythrobacter litoralis TaxID=39960 RepID=A0A074NFL9_9SPHN|nr:undecaprenyl-diphosphate phosphatase [Erythrobacter litoralis]AOL24897.1 undecaprenyl-diphosphatase [Erythrobacter litoralis]KEO96422.1 UDP pyrophosphate phosphatase [Erythrobacter litoralis]MEE4339118.1 undecaprenyl-diphosphate phosphatase [Erythrobacter sp.]
MTFFQMLLIAVVQGITEFLPISSSGHLILIPFLTDFPDQGPMIDIAVHVGSLLAIIVYFFKDVAGLARGGFATIGIGKAPEQRRLFWWILLGTIPAVIFGLAIKLGFLNGVVSATFGIRIVEDDLLASIRFTDLIATNLIVYGILLGLADRFGRQEKTFEQMTWRDGLIVGCAQALALIPGTSRSGVTMTAARLLGYGRFEAARFSFLLSIPAVAGAGVLIVPDLLEADSALLMDAIVTGTLTFIAAFATMAFLMNFLKRASMMVFVVYRVLMGTALFYFF